MAVVMLAVIACLLTIAGFQGWRYYKNQQSEKAAMLYNQLMEAERAKLRLSSESSVPRALDWQAFHHYMAFGYTPGDRSAGLARGEGGLSPALLTVMSEKADYAFLSLKSNAFDLTDRGVSGRAVPAAGMSTSSSLAARANTPCT